MKPLRMYIDDADIDKVNWMSEAMVNRVPNTLSFTATFFLHTNVVLLLSPVFLCPISHRT